MIEVVATMGGKFMEKIVGTVLAVLMYLCFLAGGTEAGQITSADVGNLYQRVISDKHLSSQEGNVRVWKTHDDLPGWECLNFANWAFRELHGGTAGRRDGSSHNLIRDNGVRVVFRYPEKDKLEDLELALTNGRITPGDFIQWAKNSDGMSHHSAIFGEYDAVGKRIRIMDSNRSQIWNQLRYDWMPLKKFLWRCDRGVAFYTKERREKK